MIISIASGKGGTGKTTVATGLSLSCRGSVQLLDCDVEEPNAFLFLKPEMMWTQTVTIPVPSIDMKKCTFCGRCAEICEYNALAVLKDQVLVFADLCHGCGGCSLLCPEGAIVAVGKKIGVVEKGRSGHVDFVHGKLNTGEVLSPPLIKAVKRQIDGAETVILDAPPGTACPVVTSVSGSDFCILVTEPTPFGLHDLDLAVQVLRKMSIPIGVVINRDGIGDDGVERYCRKKKIPLLARIPFDREISSLYSRGIPISEGKDEYRELFRVLLEKVKELV